MEYLEQNCILCGSATYSNFYKLDPYSLVKCSACGLIRVSPMPDEEERKRINQSIYSSGDHKKRYFKDERFFKRRFKDKLKKIEKTKPKKGKMLDIGCGYGFFLEIAKKRGWDIYGVEINPTIGTYIKDKFGERIFIGKFENAHFKTHKFDVITLWDVIEHTLEPVKFLNNIKRHLTPSGIICIQTPNIESYISELKNKNWDWLTPGDHLYFFSPKTLHSTLELAGLRPIYFNTWEPNCYFIDSLVAFNEINNLLFRLYRKSIVRVLRKIFFLLFSPIQWYQMHKNRGALLEIYATLK